MKYLCIHGHFYQPPRENAWLDEIEIQESAAPFHDWNARICAECYAPNTLARVLNDKQQLTDLINNYARISFNFGPTLLSWMEKKEPEVYRAILEADSTVSVVHTNWREWDVSRRVMTGDGRGCHGGSKQYRMKGSDLLLPIVTETSLHVIHLCTACYRKDAVMRRYWADTYLFRSRQWNCEDIPVAFALCLEGDVVFLDEETLVYRVGQDSLSAMRDEHARFRFGMGMAELSFYLSEHYGVRGCEVDAYFRYRYYALLMHVLRDRDVAMAREVRQLAARLGVPFSLRERCLYAIILHDALYRPAKLLRDGVVWLKRRLRR